MQLNMEPQVIESIRRHRRGMARQKLMVVAPLLLAILFCLAVLVILTVTGRADWGRVFSTDMGPSFLLWVPLLAITALLFLAAMRSGAGELVIVEEAGDANTTPFRDALDGLGNAVGIPAPPLFVVRMPTVNSLAFLKAGRPAVGISPDALSAGLGPRKAEAMMAHELAHILTGEIYPAASSRRFQMAGCAMVSGLLMMVVLVTLTAGLSAWTGFALLAAAPLLVFWAAWRSRFIARHNDLLSDSIACKLTFDPEGLKETVTELNRLFMENPRPFNPKSRFPFYLFVYRVRPELMLARAREMYGTFDSRERQEDFSQDMDRWIKRTARFPRDTLEMRLRNLEAIELGHWPVFECSKSVLP